MKTQINTLVNGSKSVIGRAEDFKGGSSYYLRGQIAEKVQQENKDTMIVEVNGLVLTLNRKESISGKTVNFSTDLNKEQFAQITGFGTDITGDSLFSFSINNDMTCQIDKFARKNERCNWQHRGWSNIAESLVTIK